MSHSKKDQEQIAAAYQQILNEGWMGDLYNKSKKGLKNAAMATTIAAAGLGGTTNANAQEPYNASTAAVQQAQNSQLAQTINQLPFEYSYRDLQLGSQWNVLNEILPNSFKDVSKKLELAKINLNGAPESMQQNLQQEVNTLQQRFNAINKGVQLIKNAKDNNQLNYAIQLLPQDIQQDVAYRLKTTIERLKEIKTHSKSMENIYSTMDKNLDKIK
jgi:hypothetical protein